MNFEPHFYVKTCEDAFYIRPMTRMAKDWSRGYFGPEGINCDDVKGKGYRLEDWRLLQCAHMAFHEHLERTGGGPGRPSWTRRTLQESFEMRCHAAEAIKMISAGTVSGPKEAARLIIEREGWGPRPGADPGMPIRAHTEELAVKHLRRTIEAEIERARAKAAGEPFEPPLRLRARWVPRDPREK